MKETSPLKNNLAGCANNYSGGGGQGLGKNQSELRVISTSSLESPFFGGRSGMPDTIPDILEDTKMGEVSLIVTVVNVFAGLGLLSQPYAMALLGWSGILVLFLVIAVMNWTSKIIIFTMELVGAKTFPELAEGSIGALGRQIVAVGVILEVIGAMLTCFEFIFRQLMFLVPELTPMLALGISFAACLPSIWILDFSRLRFLSGIGAISNITLGLVVAFVSVAYEPMPKREVEVWKLSPINIALSSGIFVFAAGAHATLPRVYNQSVCSASRWATLMNYCFLIIGVIYAIMGGCGYYIYGNSVDVLVTQNLIEYPGGILPKIVTVLILIGTFCKISPLMVVAGELTESWIGISTMPWLQRLYRTIIFLCVTSFAYILRDDVDLLEALTGSIATSLTALLVPALGYTIATGSHLCQTVGDIFRLLGLVLAVGLSLLLMFGNCYELVNRSKSRFS
ncbi:hypothetical protein AAMO2058_000877200 [Amorphochlora amoebiformis]